MHELKWVPLAEQTRIRQMGLRQTRALLRMAWQPSGRAETASSVTLTEEGRYLWFGSYECRLWKPILANLLPHIALNPSLCTQPDPSLHL